MRNAVTVKTIQGHDPCVQVEDFVLTMLRKDRVAGVQVSCSNGDGQSMLGPLQCGYYRADP